MTPEMLETLYRISLLHAPEPDTVFREIAEAVSAQYGGTMAMVNVMEGNCIRFHTVINPHRIFDRLRTTVNPQEMQITLCDGPIRHRRPLLIQNAQEHPEFCHHIVVRLKLRRYLGVPICNPSGDAVGTLCFLDDRIEEPLYDEDIRFLSLLAMRVSAELERERMIEARVAEQRAHAERLADMNRRLLETAEERRHFVSMVIHDLRHPLTTFRTCLSLLRIETSKKQRNAHLDMLDRRTRALSALLDELVVYDRIEAGYPLLTVNEIDLATHIRECIEEATDLTSELERGVPIHFECAPDLGVAHLDGGKLRHILLNLLANALKFTPEGHITVRARLENADQWRLEVEDTGIGMSLEAQARAFEEYFTGAEVSSSGVGLGLAITRRLCAVLNAQITLESTPGTGTCFRLLLPRRLMLFISQETRSASTNGANELEK